MKLPRICIIGAGALASRRIYPYIATAGAKLIGVCDLDEAKAQHNAALYGGQAYTDFNIMLSEQKPDAVIICIGPEAHAKLSTLILKAGYPVYTEKPPAVNAASALQVAKLTKDLDMLCVNAFKKRYTTAAQRATEWIGQFDPSDLLSISADYCSGQYDENHPHGFLLDFAIHILDLIQYLFGDVAEVFAYSKGDSAYTVSLRFVNGAVGSLNLNEGRAFNIPTEEIEITARGGNFMTIHNSSSWRIVENNKAVDWREPPTFTSQGDSGRETGHLTEIEDFIQAVVAGRKTSKSQIYESYKTMALYDAIVESTQSGRTVKPIYEPLS